MSLGNQPPSMQSFHLLLYQRALHPELFRIQDRRSLRQSTYEMEGWVVPSGHVLRLQRGNACLTEVVLDGDHGLPERGLLQSFPCFGEKEHDQAVDGRMRYIASIQTEHLSDNLYMATFHEMKEFASGAGALWHEWSDPEGGVNLSILDIQRYKREAHAQSYHLVGPSGFVLRTQSIVELQ